MTNAISSQNAQIAVGQLGGTPSVDNQALNATINAQSLLQTPEQFRNITLRVNQDGSEVRLGDVATVELGAEKYDYLSRFNGNQASGLGIKLASGANEMETAELVIDRLDELSQYFPHGLEYKVAYETTSFVKASIKDVVKTLLEAILLVFLVMYLFLQNFRATLIPTIAVPVVLLGTFAVLYAFGYSINTLTMFAMVLAIGLLVDDAIVVVENVERIMSEEGLSRAGRRRANPWGRSRARWSGSRWCCRRYLCRWRSLAAPRARSTASSPSPSSRRWCSRCWWR